MLSAGRMSRLSSLAESPAAAEPRNTASPGYAPWAAGPVAVVREFLLRRRVKLSAMLFISLATQDYFTGVRPHDVTDWSDPGTLLGLSLVVAGLALRSWSAGVLCKETILAQTGPYGLIRNPLYVGSFLMMFGFCALLGERDDALFIAGPVLGLYLLKIAEEDRFLLGRFPAEWPAYAARTPRFFPRRLPRLSSGGWCLSQWLQSNEYRTVVTTFFAVCLLKLWRLG
jgi:protein-S-isoprenylcysteine O-methyltransferase Ste14